MNLKIIAGTSIFLLGMIHNGFAETETTAVSTSVAYGSGVANNVNGGQGIGSVTQTFSGSDPVPFLPGVIGGPVVQPSLFNIYGKPANAMALPLLVKTAFIPAIFDDSTGKSGNTDITYNAIGLKKRSTRDSDLNTVELNVVGESYGQVVGSLTIQSKPSNAIHVDFSTLIYDASFYLQRRMDLQGYKLTLLTIPEAVSSTSGVNTKSQGVALSPVLSGFINGPLGMLTGLSAGGAKGNGVTAPVALIGCTFLIVADTEKSAPIDIRVVNGFSREYDRQQKNGSNGNGKHGDDETEDTVRKNADSMKSR